MNNFIRNIALVLIFRAKHLILLWIFIFSFIINSNAQLSVNAGRDQVICYGDGVVIGGAPTASGGSGPYTYSWYPSDGLSATNIANPYAEPSTHIKYTVRVISGTDTLTDQTEIFVAAQSGGILGLSANYCFSSSAVTLTGYPAGGTFSGSGISGNTFTPSSAGIGTKIITYDYVESPQLPITVFEDNFSTDRGWTGYGSGGWSRTPVDPLAPACVGMPQPTEDATINNNDNYVLGTFVNSCYDLNMPQTYYITSPIIDCSNLSDVNIQYAQSSSFHAFLDTFCVEVYGKDNAWHKLSKTNVNFLSWYTQSFLNVSHADNNPNFRVRFGIGPTNATEQRKGWRIDDFKVSGLFNATCNNQSTDTTYVWADVNPDAGSNKTICLNDSVQLNAQNLAGGASTFSWSPVATLSNPNISNPWAKPTVTTTYRVTITNAGGCTARDSVIVKVNPLPNVTIAPANATICEGNSVTLTASGAGVGGTYTWNLSIGTGASKIVSPTVNTTYRVTGVDANGCRDVASSRVTVNALPNVKASVDNDTVCIGTQVQLSATGAVSYTWSNGATDSLVNVTPMVTTTYRVTGTDANSCSKTDAVRVVVNPLPNITITATKDSICFASDSSRLTASGGSSYVWDNGLGGGASKYVKPTVTTTYSVTGTDANGCTNTASYIVKVNPLPTVGITVTKTVICINDTLTLIGTGANTYIWNSGLGAGNPKIVNPAVNTNYRVTGTDAKGCTNTANVVITVNALPNVTATANPNPICAGSSTTISGGGASTYSWNTGSTLNSISVSPASNTTYRVTGTDANSCSNTASRVVTVNALPNITITATKDSICFASDSSMLTASGGSSYVWDNGLGGGASKYVKPTVTTTYSVTGTDANGCTNTASYIVKVNPLPTVGITVTKTVICINDTLTLIGTGANTYIWNSGLGAGNPKIVNPAVNTNYRVTGTDAKGCTNTANVVITVNALPNVTATANPNPICAGSSTTISGGGASTYSWNTGSTLNSISVSPASNTTYRVTGTDANSCSNTASRVVTVNAIPSVSISASNLTICRGNSTTLTASGATTYSWAHTVNTNASQTVSPLSTTTYTVTGTSSGCSNTAEIVITVNQLPTVGITADKMNVCPSETVTLTASGANAYAWSHTVNTDSLQTATPATTTTYRVTGTDANSCSNTSSIVITVYSVATTTVTAVPNSICIGGTSQLQATNGVGYSWTPSATLDNDLIGTPLASPTVTTTYRVTVTNTNGCTVTGIVTVTVNTPPAGSAGADMTICVGNSTTLSASGGNAYSWSPASGIVSGGLTATPTVNPIVTTTFTVTVTNAFGCTATDIAVVTVNQLPTVSITANKMNVCPSETVTLTASGANAYAWNIGGSENPKTVTPATTSTYRVTGTDANNCSNTASIVITVYSAATTAVTAIPNAICIGQTSQLQATNGSKYIWSPSLSLSNDTISNPLASPTVTTTYRVTVTNTNGCTVTGSVTVTISNPATIDAGSDVSICTGASVQLNATSTGTTFAWSPLAEIVSGGNTLTPTVNPASTTTFTVSAYLGACVSTDDVVVYANPLVVNASNNQTICKGNTITLNAYGANSYLWSNGQSGSSINVTPLTTTTYRVTGTYTTCTSTAQVVVTVNSLNLSISGLNATYCENAPAVVVKGHHSGGIFYGPGIINDSIFSPELAGVGTHTITYLNSDTFTVISDFFFDDFSSMKGWTGIGEGGWNIAPITIANNCDGIYLNPTEDYSPFSTDNYILGTSIGDCYENNMDKMYYFASPWINCEEVEEVKVSFYSHSAFENPNDEAILQVFDGIQWNTIYSNQITPIQENAWTLKTFDVSAYADKNNNFKIRFGIGPTDATGRYKGWRIDDFSIVGKKQLICYDSVMQTVNVNPLPIADAGANQTICKGDTTTLSATGGVSYQWSTGNNAQSIYVYPTIDTMFYVTVTNNFNCTAIDSVSVAVSELPIADAGADQTICYGDSISITATGGITYQWSDGRIGNPLYFKPNTTTTYTLTVNDGLCVNTDDLVITVDSFYTNIIISTDTICLGGSVNLSVDTGVSFVWLPQDGSLSDSVAQNPIAKPLVTTTYSVIVSNALGCTATDTAVIIVNPLPMLTLSNDTTICSRDTITITVSGADTYLWGNGTTTSSITMPVTNTSYIYVTGYYNTGCYSIDSVLISTIALPLADAGWDRTICKGDSIFLAGFGGTDYSWNSGEDTAIIKISPPYSTTYILTVLDSITTCRNYDTVVVTVDSVDAKIFASKDTLCFGDTLQLSVTGGVSYMWYPLDGSLTDVLISNPIATPLNSTTYSVLVSGANTCVTELNMPIVVHALPIADAGLDQTICNGDTAILTASGGMSYLWNNAEATASIKVAPTDSVMYYVNVTDSNGCMNIDSVFVTVNQLPVISVGADKSICKNDSILLVVGTAPDYLWSTGATNDSIYVSPDTTTIYTVIGIENNCSAYDTIVVMVDSVTTEITADKTIICLGDSINLSATNGSTYTWLPNASTLSDTSISNPIAKPTVNITYTVSITGANSCTATDTISVIVNPLPIANAGIDQIICLNDTAVLTATGAIDYLWSNNSAIISSLDTATINVLPNATDIYIVRVTDANGCIDIDTVGITVNPLPVINISGTTMICNFDSTLLTATGGLTYSWFSTEVIPNNTIDSILVKPSNDTKYFVSVTDTNACNNIDSVEVIVNPLPNVVATATPDTICLGDKTRISVIGATSYSWDDAILSTAQSIDITPTASVTYIVTGTDAKGCTNIDTIEVVVNSLPLVEITADTNYICRGVTLTLKAINAVNYFWSTAETTESISVTPDHSIIYAVTGTDANGCSATDDFQLNVFQLPTVTIDKTITEICFGSSITLMADGANTYTWDNGVGIGANVTVAPTSETLYTVTGYDTNGCSDMDTMTVVVNPLPIVDAGPAQTICIYDSVQLNAYGGIKFQWDNPSTLNTPIWFNPWAKPTVTTTYTVTVTNGKGCSDTDITTVTVNPLPTITVSPDKEICMNDTTTLAATGGITYKWFPERSILDNTKDTIIVFPTVSISYMVTVTDANSCSSTSNVFVTVNPLPDVKITQDKSVICMGDSAILTATGATSYLWSNGSTMPIIKVSPTDTTTYFVEGTDGNGCKAYDTVSLAVNLIPIADAGIDREICFGDTVTIKANEGMDMYNWTSGDNTQNSIVKPSLTTTYILTVTKDGCTDTDDIVVTVYDNPVITVTPDQWLCYSDSVVLTATGGDNYYWNTGDSTASINVKPTATTTYLVTTQNQYNCTVSDSVIVYINELPITNVSSDKSICVGQTVSLWASGADLYSWEPASSLDDNLSATPIASPTTTTTYTLTLTNTKGNCTATTQVVVNVFEYPNISYSKDTNICRGSVINLWASGGDTYKWSNGSKDSIITIGDTASIIYAVTVSKNGCEKASGAIVVNVFQLPFVDAGKDTMLCIGDTIMLTATSSSVFNTYTWESINMTDITSQSPQVFPINNTIYRVTTTDINGCSASDFLNVKVNALPIIATDNLVYLCINDSVEINVTGAKDYIWDNGKTGAAIYVKPTDNATYKVTATDINGCSATDEVNVIINGLPTAYAGEDRTICKGETISLLASGGESYHWSTSDTSNFINVSPSLSIIYEVTVFDVNGCSDVDTLAVRVITPKVTHKTANHSICLSDTTRLFVSGGDNYLWDNGSFDSVIYVFPDTTTKYFVTVSLYGCSILDSITVSVNMPPTITIAKGIDTAICYGKKINLIATGGATYIWADASVNDTLAVSPKYDTYYSVTAKDINGCSGTDDIWVYINSLPVISAGNDISICRNSSEFLSLTGTNIGDVIKWNTASTLSDSTIANPLASPTSTTTYRVTVSDANKCSASDDVVVTVFALPTVSVSKNDTICIYDSTTITANANGGAYYSWYPESGMNYIDVINPRVAPTVNTTYTVAVTDTNGCINTRSLSIKVNPLPIVSIGNDTAICYGDQIDIYASSGVQHKWLPQAGLSNASIYNPKAFPMVTTTYTVSVTDSNACVNTADIVITVNPLPIAFAGNDTVMCYGEQLQLNATGGVNYYWSEGNTLDDDSIQNPMASPNKTTKYTVTVIDGNRCSATDDIIVNLPPAKAENDITICYNQAVRIGASNGVSYSWSNGQTTDTIIIKETTNTFYIVSITDANCETIDTVFVNINPLPNANAGADVSICYGATTQILASGGQYYYWSNNYDTAYMEVYPTVTTTYTLTVIDNNNCSNTDDVVVYVNPLPIVSAGDDITICRGDTVQKGLVTATGGISYSWIPNTEIFDADTDEPILFPQNNKVYYVYATDANGCVGNDTLIVFINPLPVINLGFDSLICFGDTVRLRNKLANTGDTYLWSDSSTDSLLITLPKDTTLYTVTITDINNCVSTAQRQINVLPIPFVDAGLDTAICFNSSIYLNGQGGVKYKWTPALGLNNDAVPHPIATPLITTTYTLQITDYYKCTAIDSVVVTVNPNPNNIITGKQIICLQDIDTISVTGALSYVWNTGDATDTIIVSPQHNTKYIVTATNEFGCIDIDSITVKVNPLPYTATYYNYDTICSNQELILAAYGGYAYVWSEQGLTGQMITFQPQTSIDEYKQYIVTVTDTNLCVMTDTVNIYVKKAPIANAGEDVTICHNALPVILDASASTHSGNTLIWSNGGYDTKTLVAPKQTTTYFLTVQSPNACLDVDTVVVYIHDVIKPIIVSKETKVGFCDNTLDINPVDVTISLIVEPTYASYIWNNNSTDATIHITEPGYYFITVIDNNGCVEVSDTIEVKVYKTESPVVVSDKPNNTACENDTLMLFLDNDPDFNKYLSYVWSSGSVAPYIKVTNPKSYYEVTVTDRNGCVVILDGIEIILNPIPIAYFTFEDSARTIKFENLSTNANSYIWDFGNGQTSNQSNPIHTFDKDGEYKVMLTATNECASVSDYMTIEVLEYNSVEEFELLNTFSLYPNPAHHTLNIVFNSAFKGDIYLTDMIGRNIDIRNNISVPDKNTISIDISKLAPGVYFINVETDNTIAKRKFIKH